MKSMSTFFSILINRILGQFSPWSDCQVCLFVCVSFCVFAHSPLWDVQGIQFSLWMGKQPNAKL